MGGKIQDPADMQPDDHFNPRIMGTGVIAEIIVRNRNISFGPKSGSTHTQESVISTWSWRRYLILSVVRMSWEMSVSPRDFCQKIERDQ